MLLPQRSWANTTSLVASCKRCIRFLRALNSKVPRILRPIRDRLQRTVLCAIKQSFLDRELPVPGPYGRSYLVFITGAPSWPQRQAAIENDAAGRQEGLLLFFADVDNLKKINDLYGHREGDLALARIANTLEQTFRNSDIIARLGGDEFAALAIEASCENPEVILRGLEKTLKGANAEESRYELSLSVGVARFDPRHPVSLRS